MHVWHVNARGRSSVKLLHGVIDVGDIAFICPSMHMNRRAIRLAQTLAEKPRKANLLFPALGDGTVELGSPGPSAKKKYRKLETRIHEPQKYFFG